MGNFMNFNETTMSVQTDVNDFHENVVNSFLEKSKIEYPYSIVQSNSNIIDTTLLKSFSNNKYDFMYEDVIKSIEKFLKKIIPRYGLSEIKFHENAHWVLIHLITRLTYEQFYKEKNFLTWLHWLKNNICSKIKIN